MKPHALVILLAGLSCLSYVFGQEAQAPPAESLKSLHERAEKGDTKAQVNLGNVYREGEGVAQDYAEALRWHRKAAEQGEALAQYSVGVMYYRGQGVAQDYVRAHMWMNLAASRFTGDEQKNYAGVRDEVAGKMTVAQIAEAQALARNWKPKK